MHLYPKNILHDLEFDFVKNAVLDLAVTKGGQYKIQNLKPSTNATEIAFLLTQVNEFLAIYESGNHFPSMALESVKEELGLMRIKNMVLRPEQVMNIKRLVITFNHLHGFIKQNSELLEESQWILLDVEPNKEIPTEIDRIIDHHGLIKSTASKELASIRSSIERTRQAANRIFERVVKKYEKQSMLADFSESVQEDRRVLAVSSAYKNQVNGILHGSSAKNSLVFVEPGECIEVNNQLASLKDDEKKEIRRILRELTRFLSEHRSYLKEIEKRIAEIDFIHAKALYGYKIGATKPELSEKQIVAVKKAYNPVLLHFNKSKGKETVPLDVAINDEKRIVVISGPNAGGKSITLKTVGLLQLMVQCGLLVPAHPKSVFGIFSKVMVDIGDAQSIENELSTYSSKLQKMRHFLDHADDTSLVLIDEFGSGSDPDLGGALAQVFLEKLNEYKSYGIYTTHYNVIKALATQLDRVENASMLFDRQSFKPEYKLNEGIPGSSYTFEVALKSGIPKHLVNLAKEHLDKPQLKTDQLLVRIQDEKIKLTKARKELHAKVAELEELKYAQQKTIAKLEEKLKKQTSANEEMSHYLMWGKRFEGLVKTWMNDTSNKNKKALIGRFIKMVKERAGQAKHEEVQRLSKAQKAKQAQLKKLLAQEIVTGDRIKLLANKKKGVVQEIRRDKYLILLGANMTMLATRDQFVKDERK